jgi:hypothetical protein
VNLERKLRRLLSSLTRHVFRLVVYTQRHREPRDAFERTWFFFLKTSPFLWALRHEYYAQRGSCIRTNLMGMYCDFAPRLYSSVKTVVPPELNSLLDRGGPLAVMDFHQRHIGVTKCLCARGVEHYRPVANLAQMEQKARSLGFDLSVVRFMQRSIASLAQLRTLALQRNVVCCSVDFKSNGKYEYLSPAMVVLMARISIPLVFFKTHVAEDGVIHLNYMMCPNGQNAEQSLASAIHFFNSTPGDRRNFTISKFQR